jgi:TonB family protein
MTALAQALSVALLDFVWQGLLMAFLLWVALFLLRNRSAHARYAASAAALAAMALLPAITACMVYVTPAAASTPAGWVSSARYTMRTAIWVSRGAAVQSTGKWAASLAHWALPVWCAGVLLFSLRLVWGARRISALRHQSEQPEAAVFAVVARLQKRMKLARPVRVLITVAADCPSVVGWIRPALLLPAATIIGLTPQQLEAVLAHELAHILRYDYVANMLQTVVETLLFYHPAVWWASGRMRQERELCCDDLAVSACGDALCYARALTRLERLRVSAPGLAGLALGSTGGSLLYRIRRIMGEAAQGHTPSKLPGILALSLGLLCLAANMQWARAQQQDATAPEPAAMESNLFDDPGVRVDLRGANILHRDPVAYPEAALEKGVQGTVVVEATLDAKGMVSDARVLSGPPELRKTALESILQWHFTHEAAGGVRQIGITFQTPPEGSLTRGVDSGVEGGIQGGVTGGITGGATITLDGGVGGSQRSLAEERAAERQPRSGKQLLEEQLLKQEAIQRASESERSSQLSAQMLASEAQLKALRDVDQERHPDVRKLEAELEALRNQREMLGARSQELEKRLEEAANGRGTLQDAASAMADAQSSLAAIVADGQSSRAVIVPDGQSAQAADLAKHIAELQGGMMNLHDHTFTARKVTGIVVLGFTAAVRDELLSKLPVHVGDTLTAESFEKITDAVKQFDEHLSVGLRVMRDGQAEIHIAAPGTFDQWD